MSFVLGQVPCAKKNDIGDTRYHSAEKYPLKLKLRCKDEFSSNECRIQVDLVPYANLYR